MITIRPILVLALAALVAGCGPSSYDTRSPQEQRDAAERERYGTIHGRENILLFAPGRRDRDPGGSGVIGVNAYLWRATLETLDFMPLASADPFGGVIITDWYAPPESPGERFKITAYILDRALRADGLRITVFRQLRGADGAWTDAPSEARTATALEDTILTRARELRVASVAQG
jgi:hypothetical protein